MTITDGWIEKRGDPVALGKKVRRPHIAMQQGWLGGLVQYIVKAGCQRLEALPKCGGERSVRGRRGRREAQAVIPKERDPSLARRVRQHERSVQGFGNEADLIARDIVQCGKEGPRLWLGRWTHVMTGHELHHEYVLISGVHPGYGYDRGVPQMPQHPGFQIEPGFRCFRELRDGDHPIVKRDTPHLADHAAGERPRFDDITVQRARDRDIEWTGRVVAIGTCDGHVCLLPWDIDGPGHTFRRILPHLRYPDAGHVAVGLMVDVSSGRAFDTTITGSADVSQERVILAIDQGTTSSRAVLFDRHGKVLGSEQAEIEQIYPHSGWVNQDAAHIWDVTRTVMQRVVSSTGVDVAAIAGIGITNQRETTVLWDRVTGEPVAPAIVWQSRQTAPLVDDIIARGQGERYRRITGLVPDAYFSATKIAWILDRDPEIRRRAEAGDLAAGTIDSWLLWNLSGGSSHLTDYSNASRTMLYDIRSLAWSDELLADLAIPSSLLPEVHGNADVLCETDAALLGRAVPVAGVAGDQQSALFGQACFAPGEAKNTYGTGSFLLMQTGKDATISTHDLLTTIAWGIDGVVEYALEGAIFVTGAAVQWLRDGLGIIDRAADVEPLAASVNDSGGVTFVPALAGLGAPYWDAGARGTITGLSRGSTAAHIARATLEAIAFRSRDVLDAMQADSGITLEELRVDGGAAANDLLMQIQADVLGVPVVRPRNLETTVLGAAYLSGLAVGVWSDREEVRATWEVDRRFEPSWSELERASRYAGWKDAVGRTLTREMSG